MRRTGFNNTAMLAAIIAGLGAGLPMIRTETYTTPRQEPDNRGRRAEKGALAFAKAEAKRQRKAVKRRANSCS